MTIGTVPAALTMRVSRDTFWLALPQWPELESDNHLVLLSVHKL